VCVSLGDGCISNHTLACKCEDNVHVCKSVQWKEEIWVQSSLSLSTSLSSPVKPSLIPVHLQSQCLASVWLSPFITQAERPWQLAILPWSCAQKCDTIRITVQWNINQPLLNLIMQNIYMYRIVGRRSTHSVGLAQTYPNYRPWMPTIVVPMVACIQLYRE